MAEPTVSIEHHSDVLRIRACGGQIRMEELRRRFPEPLAITYRFIPLSGCTERRIGEGWRDRGGYAGFGEHVREAASDRDHVTVHPGAWRDAAPASSVSPRPLLKAVQLFEQEEGMAAEPVAAVDGRSLFEQAVREMRRRFFAEARDIARVEVREALAGEPGLPMDRIRELRARGVDAEISTFDRGRVIDIHDPDGTGSGSGRNPVSGTASDRSGERAPGEAGTIAGCGAARSFDSPLAGSAAAARQEARV